MGKASRIGAGLRRLFEPVLSQPLEKSVRDNQAIIAPAYTNAVNIDIAAACYNMNEFVPVGNYHTSVNITYNKIAIPEQVIPFPFSIPSGSITAVLITLKYLQRKKGIETIVQNLRWLPCGIGCGYVC